MRSRSIRFKSISEPSSSSGQYTQNTVRNLAVAWIRSPRGREPSGRIAFVRSRRARAVTGYGTVSKDGTLLDSFRVRAVKALKGLGGMFFKKSEYKDEEDNLLK